MAEKLQIYKCAACGNIVEVLHGGAGQVLIQRRHGLLVEGLFP